MKHYRRPAPVVREMGASYFTRDRRAEKKRLALALIAREQLAIDTKVDLSTLVDAIRAALPERAAEIEAELGPSVVPSPIDEVMRWARTDRGGEQFTLFQPRTGCARWGVCDMPKRGAA